MFKRLLWLVIGAAFGFGCSWWITRTIRRTIEKLTPDQLREVVSAFPNRIRDALAEGREGMIERELELRAALEPGSPLPSQLYPARLRERVGVVYLPPADERRIGPGSRPAPGEDAPPTDQTRRLRPPRSRRP